MDKILDYLNGALSATELQAFEAKMNQDEDFRKEVLIQKDILQGLKYRDKKETEDSVRYVHEELKKEGFFDQNQSKKGQSASGSKKLNNNSRWMAIAASICFFLAATLFFNKGDHTSSSDLMANYFNKNEKGVEAEIADLVSFGMADTEKASKDSLRMALQAYKKGEYELSRSILDKYLKNYGENSTARYYLGLALMNSDQYASALKQFEFVEHDPNFKQMHWMKYNKALCYLSQDNDEQRAIAKEELEEIINDPGFSETDRQAIESLINFAKK